MYLKLVDFILNNENWEELLSQTPYCIKITRDSGYIIFKYNQIESDFSNEIVKECRGLILREKDFKPVCVPFFKFMNAEETNSDIDKIDWSNAFVQEKVDGSLMKVWFDNEWHVSTNGTINAENAPLQTIENIYNYKELFMKALEGVCSFEDLTIRLNKDFTYMFELVSPYSRVVIPYEKTELYYLGARNNLTMQEYRPEQTGLSTYEYFKMPKRYDLHSYEDVRNFANELPWDEEGFVVCDKEFNRVKIKSLEYLKAHYTRTNNCISYERLLEVVLAGEEEEFLIYASDYKEVLEKIKTTYYNLIDKIKEEVANLKPESFSSRKEMAAYINDTKPQWLRSFLFAYDKLELALSKMTTKKWVELIEGELINE